MFAIELTALAHIVLLQLGGPTSWNYPEKHFDILSIVSSEPGWQGYLNVHESVHCDMIMKVTNKVNYTG
jgi:hypothetical protein